MGKFSLYNVPLRNLSEGIHQLDYTLGDQYFKLIGDSDSDVKKGHVKVEATVKRVSSTFEFNFSLEGTVTVPCDRCLDDIIIEVNSNNRLIVKFGKEYSEESDEVVIIPEEEGEINIAWFLYEFVTLSIPMKRVHAPGKCNKTMSTKLNKHKAVSSSDDDSDDDDFDDSTEESIDEDVTDPRWDALKGLVGDEE
ncbi:YceD family protein [Dysgonomonas macrotermitis]|uniref:Uncharacterized metal-binding protein YceD, DUF177 family n=1 Tax=Dysgonomonas macrotermitis TaxID=1346286 RepID=A0A1M4YT32_9BACT|nr:DUF177 domain-containing protein [Dysgonomonas macrotermitis]SHF08911.1 Uncharacterized metal-binding protein YceD, DUF177 family [Dysgonomonas macrotermitis]